MSLEKINTIQGDGQSGSSKDSELSARIAHPAFTPGPWYLDGPNTEGEHSCGHEHCVKHPKQMIGYSIRHRRSEDDLVWIADTLGEHVEVPLAEAHANAHLIVAAPAMYAALHALVLDCEDYEAWQRPCMALDMARAALALANGQSTSAA